MDSMKIYSVLALSNNPQVLIIQTYTEKTRILHTAYNSR